MYIEYGSIIFDLMMTLAEIKFLIQIYLLCTFVDKSRYFPRMTAMMVPLWDYELGVH
jgi:hypothetical protein